MLKKQSLAMQIKRQWHASHGLGSTWNHDVHRPLWPGGCSLSSQGSDKIPLSTALTPSVPHLLRTLEAKAFRLANCRQTTRQTDSLRKTASCCEDQGIVISLFQTILQAACYASNQPHKHSYTWSLWLAVSKTQVQYGNLLKDNDKILPSHFKIQCSANPC